MKIKQLKNFAICAALAVAIFGGTQSAHAQILGRLFGFGGCYGGNCASGQCYGGACYSGKCYGGNCASGQCYGGACYSGKCYGGNCTNGKCSTAQAEHVGPFSDSIATSDEVENAKTDAEPTPLGDDWNKTELETLDLDAPTCSPCRPVQKITVETPTRRRPIAEGVAAAANAIAENVYLARVNRVRAQYGLRALTLDKNLDYQCSAACRNCAAHGAIFHAPGCGAEILAANSSRGIDAALNQWLWSQAHARLLLNPSFTRCGVQTYVDANGRNYCAMRFR